MDSTKGYSTNTTAPASSDTTTTGGDCSTPEVTTGHQSQTGPAKVTETNTKLPHHCFRYVTCHILNIHLLSFIRNAVKLCTVPVAKLLYSRSLISQTAFVQSFLIFFSQIK